MSSGRNEQKDRDIISDVNMAYSEHARRYLAECGLSKNAHLLPVHQWQKF